MKNILTILTLALSLSYYTAFAQTKVVTTGNNLVNPADPLAADIVIGSDQGGGIRHDASMMWWSNTSASRISLTDNIFFLSSWASPTANANIGLSAGSGGASFFLGNVSIGTTDSKGYKFAVNGYAIATAIFVKQYANWPDYVFKKDYALPALNEVKTYIDRNQHLPEIPSADEIAKDGQNLGEMNRLLLKKVEELTLYLIENDRKDKEKDKLLASLQDQINELKRQPAATSSAVK